MPIAGLTVEAICRRPCARRSASVRRRRPTSAPVNPTHFEGRNTTHFSVIDRDGNAVSNTYTLNFSYGLGLVADGTGVLLNNELDDFTAKPGAANAYGLVGYDANLPGPGKRPLSSMTPTIVLKDGKPFLITGSPGGSRIITTVLQVIVERDRLPYADRRSGQRAAPAPSVAAGRSSCRARFYAGCARRLGRTRPQDRTDPIFLVRQLDRSDGERPDRRL